MREVILVRHGESDDNVAGRVTGQSDAKLTERGRAQAEATAARLAAEGDIAAVYASDLPRATQTAAIVAAALALPVVEHAGFRERSMGTLTGLHMDDLRRRFPREFIDLRRRSPTFRPPEGETLAECAERAEAALRAVLELDRPGRVVVVTHAVTIALLLERALFRIEPGAVSFEIEHCALHRFRLGGVNEVRVVAMNDTGHLPPSLRDDSSLTRLVRSRGSVES